MKPVAVSWNLAPRGLKAAAGTVHVFSAPLDLPAMRLKELAQWLSEDEWQRAERFHLERDHQRFIAGRGTLREILGALLDTAPAGLEFSYGVFGKPKLTAPVGADSLHFNVAHSDSIAVFATAKHELGVDVERIRALDETGDIATRFFSSREKDCLQALAEEQRQEAFFNCWTRKEAYLKAIGARLDDALSQVEVSLAPGEAAELLSAPENSRPWQLHSLNPAAGFVAALAVQPADSHVNCWSWSG